MHLTIKEVKQLVRGHNLIVKDVSGDNSYGYDFAIFRSEVVESPVTYTRAVGKPLAASTSIYEADTINKISRRGAFRTVFNRADVEALINA